MAKWAERPKFNKAPVTRLTNSTQAVGIASLGMHLTPRTHFSSRSLHNTATARVLVDYTARASRPVCDTGYTTIIIRFLMSSYGRRRTIRYSAIVRHCALPLISVSCWNNARTQSPFKYVTMKQSSNCLLLPHN